MTFRSNCAAARCSELQAWWGRAVGELGAALFGLDRMSGGTINLRGREVAPLIMQTSVIENSTLVVLNWLQSFGFIDSRASASAAAVEPLFDELALKYSSYNAGAGSLSGGNQQKVLLAKYLLAGPDVLFLGTTGAIALL